MGKQRRNRTKFHLNARKEFGEDNSINKAPDTTVEGFKLDIPDNIFKGVNIDLEKVNRNTFEEDSKSIRSVKSLSKSVKSFKRSLGNIHLRKNETRLLRRNLFLKKLQNSYQHLKNGENNKKRRENLFSIAEMDKVLPNVDMVFHKPKSSKENPPEIITSRNRGISKAKDRKKSMINNLESFKKLLDDGSFTSNTISSITNCIEQKVFSGDL